MAISDIDILKDGGGTWTNWLGAAQVPDAVHQTYGTERSNILKCFENSGKDMKSFGGTDLLEQSDKLAATMFFEKLAEFGIFVVSRGEVEQWLPALQVVGKKTAWAVAMLERLGSDPIDPTYVRPASDDVWAFMREIVKWVKNPARRGMI